MLHEVMRDWLNSVPTIEPRHNVEERIQGYCATYGERNIVRRLAMFSADTMFENPVGLSPLQGKAALEEFWTTTNDWLITVVPEKSIVLGNEALCIARITIETEDQERCAMQGYLIFAFDTEFLICQLRCFYHPI